MCLHAIEVYSDIPLSVLLVLALGSFLLGIRGRSAYWALMGVFSAEAIFIKDEGLFFVLPLLLSASLFLWHNDGGKLPPTLRGNYLSGSPFLCSES